MNNPKEILEEVRSEGFLVKYRNKPRNQSRLDGFLSGFRLQKESRDNCCPCGE